MQSGAKHHRPAVGQKGNGEGHFLSLAIRRYYRLFANCPPSQAGLWTSRVYGTPGMSSKNHTLEVAQPRPRPSRPTEAAAAEAEREGEGWGSRKKDRQGS